jgi:hypothetical protein
MSPLALSSILFVLMLGGVFLGALLRGALPKHHLSKDSQDVVRLGVGLIATMAALVVGLLIAAAKGSYDTQSGEVKQITADMILLDNLLAQYGPETSPIRQQIREVIPSFAGRIWQEKAVATDAPYIPSAAAEKIYQELQTLSPQNELQRSLQARTVQISTDLAQTRLLLFTQSNSSIPLPFLGVLAFWLIIIFASFSLFASLNATVFVSLSLFAMSASCAIFLILELSEPFIGLLKISSAPLLNALPPLAQ